MIPEINPLDHFKKRKLNWFPIHFKKIKLSPLTNCDKLEDWIKYRLHGRYCIVNMPSFDNDDKVRTATFVGFEDEKEITYFMLACPYLRSF